MSGASRIYVGTMRHRRFEPVSNDFSYSLYMAYLDLDELETAFDGALMRGTSLLPRFRRADYLGDPQRPLDECVRELVESRIGKRPEGPVRMLTNLRHLGYVFNPVTFYYCFDAAGEKLEAVAAEITNIPWAERSAYAVAARSDGGRARAVFDKDFHVSPFMDMDVTWDWSFRVPGESLMVHMNDLREGRKIFDATLRMTPRPATLSTLRRIAMRHPMMSAKVAIGIYFQALRLKLKGSPVYPNPGRLQPADERT